MWLSVVASSQQDDEGHDIAKVVQRVWIWARDSRIALISVGPDRNTGLELRLLLGDIDDVVDSHEEGEAACWSLDIGPVIRVVELIEDDSVRPSHQC